MRNGKIIDKVLMAGYVEFVTCILFWIGVGTNLFGEVSLWICMIMGLVLCCSLSMIMGLYLVNRYYGEGIEENISNLENLNTRLRTQRHEYLNEMQIVHGLLELDEYEEAKKYLEPVFHDIAKINKALKTSKPAINALLQAKMETAEKNGVTMYLEVSSNLSELTIDQWELCKVMANLIDNAFSAVACNDGDKSVHIEIGEDIGNYRFCVYNNGPVIPKEKQELIFKKGYSTKSQEGHGLGLMIIRDILNKNQGTIKVDSREGKTTFHVAFKK